MQNNLLIFFSATMLKMITNSDQELLHLLNGSGLSIADLNNPRTRISFSTLERLVQNAEEFWDRPGLGLYFGSHLSAIQFGVVGHTIATSSNVDEAIKLFLKYYKLRLRMLDIMVSQDSGQIIVEIRHTIEAAKANRYYVDNSIAAAKRLLLSLIDNSDIKVTAKVTYDDGGYRELYEQTFPDGIAFNSDKNIVCFHGLTGKEKMAFANEINSVAARQLCEEELKLFAQKDPVATQVKEIISNNRAKPPKLTQVARDLGYSERNLRRLLGEEGHNYRALVTKVRSEYAAHLLKSSNMPVIEVAQMLGYDGYANFSRAFKSWFEKSPAEYRRENKI